MNELAKKLTSIILVCDDPNEFSGVFEEIQENIKKWIKKNNVNTVKVYVDKYGVDDCFGIDYFKSQIKEFAPDIEVNIVNNILKYVSKDNRWYLNNSNVNALENHKESEKYYYDEADATFETLIQKID